MATTKNNGTLAYYEESMLPKYKELTTSCSRKRREVTTRRAIEARRIGRRNK